MENLSQVATITWGTTQQRMGVLHGQCFRLLLAMLTSYWGLSGSLVSNIFDHFMIGRDTIPAKRLFVLTLVCIPPFFIAYSNAANFVDALYFAGTFGGVFIATLPIFMLNRARKANPERLPWQCGWYACRPGRPLFFCCFWQRRIRRGGRRRLYPTGMYMDGREPVTLLYIFCRMEQF